MSKTSETSSESQGSPSASPPFRFYDNRQKYLAFVNTCNEKAVIARRAAQELSQIEAVQPALRIFDAGMGDGTVATRIMSSAARHFPSVPLLVVAKEVSLEDVRLGLEKLPNRFCEHPFTVFVVTNLSYAEAPHLTLSSAKSQEVQWRTVRLRGKSSWEYAEQIEALGPMLTEGWQTKPSPKTGNPTVVNPTVLVIYREDHEFMLEPIIPKPETTRREYDFILCSQPWRASTSAVFKVKKIVAPLSRTLRPGGKLLVVQSCGGDPGSSIVERLWPDVTPFPVNREQLLNELKKELGSEAQNYLLENPSNEAALFQYHMHTLPSELGDRIGTSTLFAAWNAVIYVNQIEDERLEPIVASGAYGEPVQEVLRESKGLWFNDEAFVVTRRKEA